MALPQKLKTSPTRIVSSDLGNTIPAKLGQLESALCDIFGFTADTDITVSPFLFDNSGQIRKQLVLQKAAGPVGWRFRDSTSGKEMRICVNGTNFDFDENTGSEGTPSWTNRFRIAIATGNLTGAVFSALTPGLAPTGDNNPLHYLNATGTYTVPVAIAPSSVRLRNSIAQNVLNNTFTPLSFDTEDWDTSSYHSGANPTKIIFPSTGKYLVTGSCGFDANASGRRFIDIRMNGIPHARTEFDPSTLTSIGYLTATTIVNAANTSTSDYVELWAYQSSGITLAAVAGDLYAPTLSAYKIGS